MHYFLPYVLHAPAISLPYYLAKTIDYETLAFISGLFEDFEEYVIASLLSALCYVGTGVSEEVSKYETVKMCFYSTLLINNMFRSYDHQGILKIC
jgi:hypothetical protein